LLIWRGVLPFEILPAIKVR